MRRFGSALALCVAIMGTGLSLRAQDVITQWNFNGPSATEVPGGSLSPTPAVGMGTASLVGGTTAATSFASGVASGGSSDPVTTAPPNYGWQTTTYAAQGTQNKERGVQFLVSTTGFRDISLRYDLRHSNTSSRFEQVQYSLDGTTWNDIAFFDGPLGDTWFNGRSVDLSSITGVNDNANFGFRVVAAFDPMGSGYLPSNAASTYATTGTWRFDMVTVLGTPIGGGVTGDFNNDGQWNCDDINALTNAIATSSADLSFDMNGDGSITIDDVTATPGGWLAVGGANNPAATNGGNPFRQGDANLDGVVDGSDFGIWNSAKFTGNTAWCSGNFNADTVVDGSDFGIWNSNKFTSSDSAVVPEPAVWGLVALCLVGLRRRRLRS